jgi:hypothetical protein
VVQHDAGMTGLRFPELHVPAAGRQPALILRPWRAADVPALAAEMGREFVLGGMWARPGEPAFRTVPPGAAQSEAESAAQGEAARWLASQDRGWRDGDRLSLAVLEQDDGGGLCPGGQCRTEEPRRGRADRRTTDRRDRLLDRGSSTRPRHRPSGSQGGGQIHMRLADPNKS